MPVVSARDEQVAARHGSVLGALGDRTAAKFLAVGVRDGHGVWPLWHLQCLEQATRDFDCLVQVLHLAGCSAEYRMGFVTIACPIELDAYLHWQDQLLSLA